MCMCMCVCVCVCVCVYVCVCMCVCVSLCVCVYGWECRSVGLVTNLKEDAHVWLLCLHPRIAIPIIITAHQPAIMHAQRHVCDQVSTDLIILTHDITHSIQLKTMATASLTHFAHIQKILGKEERWHPAASQPTPRSDYSLTHTPYNRQGRAHSDAWPHSYNCLDTSSPTATPPATYLSRVHSAQSVTAKPLTLSQQKRPS